MCRFNKKPELGAEYMHPGQICLPQLRFLMRSESFNQISYSLAGSVVETVIYGAYVFTAAHQLLSKL